MQIVIDIPEELISKIDDENYQNVISWYDTTLYCAIKNGTPLPKGYGELKDVSVIIDDLARIRTYSLQQATDIETFKRMLINAPTIIEADKESEDVE